MPTTAHSTVNDLPLHLGKHPAEPVRSGTVRYGELRGSLARAGLLPRIPKRFGHGHDLRDWLMLGNGPDDTVFPGFHGCGDCAWAGPAHAEMEAARAAGRAVPRFTGAVVVEQYAEYSGYDARTGQNDTGSNPQDVFRWRQEKGLRDADGNVYKIGQVVALEPGNLTELWEAAYLFEDCGIGVVMTEAQDIQFAKREPWDFHAGSPGIGGHWIEVVGRPGPEMGTLLTWGQRHRFTTGFYEQQNDEAFCWVDPLRYSEVTGETAEHFSDQDLELFLRLVAQQKSGESAPVSVLFPDPEPKVKPLNPLTDPEAA